MRTQLSKQVLCLSLVCSVFLSLVCKLEGAKSDSEQSGGTLGGNKLDEESSLSSIDNVDEPYEESIVDLDENLDENDVAPNERLNKSGGGGRPAFTWSHHHEDHGLYAGRSLMTSASSKPLVTSDRTGGSSDDEAPPPPPPPAEHENEEVREGGAQPTGKKHARINDADDHQDDPLKTVDYAEKEWQLMFRAFDSAYDSVSSSVFLEIGKQTNLFEDIVSKLRAQCRRDIYYIREAVKKHKLWALRMLDSNGKLPSGITYGRFSSPGDYEECLSVQVDDKLYKDVKSDVVERHKFHGKYCLLDFRLPLPERPRDKLLSIHESVLNFTGTEIGRRFPDLIANYSGYASVFYEVGYLHGFCMPSSCDVNELARSMTKALEGMYLIVNSTIDCEERPAGESAKPIRVSQWISIALMSGVFANAALASFAHYLLPKEVRQPAQRKAPPPPANGNNHNPPGGQQVNKQQQQQQQRDKNLAHETLRRLSKLEEKKLGAADGDASGLRHKLTLLALNNKFYSDCFSIQTNFERLTKPDPRGLTFVHYTRIVAMALTVITHTGALGTLQAITKPADASNSEQIFRDLIPQMLANAFTSIQIFFFMAGFMLVISTFPAIKRDKGHISFLEYAIKRAIRLLPGLAATICLNFIWPLLVDGPMLSYFDRMIVQPCESTWWHTMAFVSNFDHVEKMCLRHSYFSASDYQLHIMAFPLLILLHKQPSLALFLAALLTMAGFVAQIIMILTKTVLPFMMVDYIDKEAFLNVVHYVHHPVWNHMSAFFYGFIVGYLVVRQIRVELSPRTIKRVWLVMMPAGIISIFAPYFWNHYKRPITKWQMVLYAIFDRSILLTSCAWLSYATMVLARRPAASKPKPKPAASQVQASSASGVIAKPVMSPIERVLGKTQTTARVTSECQSADAVQRLQVLGASGMPRQRSSPNLAGLQKGNKQAGLELGAAATAGSGRLSRTTSSSNLATIAESNQQQQQQQQQVAINASEKQVNDESATKQEQQQQQQTARPRAPAPVSNLNTLCLVLSRLTFQLYLFNMVVLWIDVNHSKYYWFFSYYFILFKAAAIYICSALLAVIFFVVMESPSLTLYIAWVKGRAAARAKRSARHTPKAAPDVTILVPPSPPLRQRQQATSITVESKEHQSDPMELTTTTTTSATSRPTFSFIDHGDPAEHGRTGEGSQTNLSATNEAHNRPAENQTKM